MRGRRGLAVSVALAAVGGGTAALSGTQVWATGTARSAVSAVPVAAAGGAAAPLATAAGVVGLAAVGALLATRRAGRTVVGLLLLLAGAAALNSAGRFLTDPGAGPYTAVGIEGATVPAAPAVAAAQVGVSAWPWLSCAAAILLVVAGLAAVVGGRGWPVLGRRYEAPSTGQRSRRAGAGATPVPAPTPPPGAAGALAARPTPATLWDDLEAGRDPTAAGPPDRGR